MDGKMIAEKRKEKGLTQDALGAMLGISGKAVSKWERGLSQPDASHIGKLTELLGLPVEQTADEADARLTFFFNCQKRSVAHSVCRSCACRLRLLPDGYDFNGLDHSRLRFLDGGILL